MTDDFSRRQAMGGMAALGALGIAGGGVSAAQPKHREHHASPAAIGYDTQKNAFVLPDLPYAYDALEPLIDEQTMRLHHGKHHAGYVKGANNALKELEKIRSGGDAGLIQHWQRQLSFHMGGHINHTLFWTGMAPENNGGGGLPGGDLAHQIKADFGSLAKFQDQFTAAAGKVEGAGWGWLVFEPASRRLLVLQMQNQQEMMFAGAVPLLGVDVWEHAYYLKYQNRRADYIEAFMRLVNWPEISRRYEAARA